MAQCAATGPGAPSTHSLQTCPFESWGPLRPPFHQHIHASVLVNNSKVHALYSMLENQSAHRRPCPSGRGLSTVGREPSSYDMGNPLKLEEACGSVGEMHAAMKGPRRIYSKSRPENGVEWEYDGVKESERWVVRAFAASAAVMSGHKSN